jgi:hypothetical protein
MPWYKIPTSARDPANNYSIAMKNVKRRLEKTEELRDLCESSAILAV